MKIARGNKDRIDIEIIEIDSDGVETPLDITGMTLLFTVKKDKNDEYSEAIIKKTVAAHDNAALGLTHVDLRGADTLKDVKKYWAFYTLLDGAGERITYRDEEFEITPSEQ
jgi:hypothetical protein